jgi:hypothetical protein
MAPVVAPSGQYKGMAAIAERAAPKLIRRYISPTAEDSTVEGSAASSAGSSTAVLVPSRQLQVLQLARCLPPEQLRAQV